MAAIKCFAAFGIVLSMVAAFHVTHRVDCKRRKVCNGNLMCAYTCERGSVKVDSWIKSSLAYQRELQVEDKLVYFEMPSTHNSAITEADGFGIEKYFISALFHGENFDQGDDLGEGVCQFLTLTDQLRMGIRHLEIDLWWDPLSNDPMVCHSPVPLYPIGEINRAAKDANITLIWDSNKLSCLGTKRSFSEVLKEVRDWMVLDENSRELVVLYFDTKFRLTADQVTKANNDILSIFSSLVWLPKDGNPLQQRVGDLLSAGKRLIIENQNDCWLNASKGDQVVFYPALWTHQFSESSLSEFPSCAVEGDEQWYGSTWVRALDGTFPEAATRCGVQIISGDYTNPDDLRLYIWSWDQQEPSLPKETGCVAMLPSGRWATLPCDTALPYACASKSSVIAGDYREWHVDLNELGSWSAARCGDGTTQLFAAPHNGFANNLLLNAAYGQTIWLNAPNPLVVNK